MKSIEYIATWTSWLTGAAAGLISFSCVVSGYGYFIDGSEPGEIMKKIGKRIRAGVLLILITTIISFLKKYWL